MNIISLNTYCGVVFQPLMAFIERMAPDTDVFCFQEMLSADNSSVLPMRRGERTNLLEEIAARLPNFDVRFAPVQDNMDIVPTEGERVRVGLATFVKKNISIISSDDFFLCNEYNTYEPEKYGTLGYNALCTKLDINGSSVTICNVHGNSQPADKLDSPERLEQSRKILAYLARQDGEKIIMGDFNLLPNTESIHSIERVGFRNLITEFNVRTTRGAYMRTLHPEHEHGPYGFQEFADYTFVTSGVSVERFEVPDLPISDHLPMVLGCTVSK